MDTWLKTWLILGTLEQHFRAINATKVISSTRYTTLVATENAVMHFNSLWRAVWDLVGTEKNDYKIDFIWQLVDAKRSSRSSLTAGGTLMEEFGRPVKQCIGLLQVIELWLMGGNGNLVVDHVRIEVGQGRCPRTVRFFNRVSTFGTFFTVSDEAFNVHGRHRR